MAGAADVAAGTSSPAMGAAGFFFTTMPAMYLSYCFCSSMHHMPWKHLLHIGPARGTSRTSGRALALRPSLGHLSGGVVQCAIRCMENVNDRGATYARTHRMAHRQVLDGRRQPLQAAAISSWQRSQGIQQVETTASFICDGIRSCCSNTRGRRYLKAFPIEKKACGRHDIA